jgi:predicted dehydrogenase
MDDKQGSTRREFLRRTTLAAGATMVAGIQRKAMAQEAASVNGKIGIGMIGCGGRGSHLTRELRKLHEEWPEFEIVAVCDVYRPRMERLAKDLGVKGYTDHMELLQDPKVHVVGIATPDHIHAQQVIDAVKAGKDVYCEKPFTHWRQFDVLKATVKAVRESGQIFQLGTQGLSDSAWHQMHALVQDGLIGKPLLAECGYFRVGDWGERGMPIDDPDVTPGEDLNWEAFLGDAPQRDFDVSRFFRWRMYEDYSGGPVTDLYPHSLTPVVYMLNAGIPRIAVGSGGKYRYEEREVPDTFNMFADYPENYNITVLGTQGNAYEGTGGRGSGGRIPILRGWDGTLTIREDEIVFERVEGVEKRNQSWKIEHHESVASHWRNLLEGVQKREQPHSNIDLAERVQTALIMGTWAYRNNTAARYDAEKQEILL